MWYNGIMIALLRSPLHGAISHSVLGLTYTGRKSGQTHTVPVNYVRDPDDYDRLLITSTPARTWWRNLRGGQSLSVRLRGREVISFAEVLEGDSATAALAAYFRGAPQMARYFEVKMVDGEPDADDVVRVAPSRVMVVVKPEATMT
jgi:deazaflavin-dependent oxidoreductase (nitroreductase family)